MKKKSMAISTTFYMIIMLALLLVLTFIYFGGTGFFQKIYKLTDKLGLTKLAKDVEEKEKNITESREKLSPEEQRAEEQIKSVVDKIVQGIQSCPAHQESWRCREFYFAWKSVLYVLSFDYRLKCRTYRLPCMACKYAHS